MDSLSTTDISGAARVEDLKAVLMGRGFSRLLADQPATRRAASSIVMKEFILNMELPGLGSAATEPCDRLFMYQPPQLAFSLLQSGRYFWPVGARKSTGPGWNVVSYIGTGALAACLLLGVAVRCVIS